MKRRAFLSAALPAVSLAMAKNGPAVDGGIVDTHTHFYDPRRKEGVPWPGPNSTLYRPIYPKDFLAVAASFGVTRTVVIEASPWLKDNQWLLDYFSSKGREARGRFFVENSKALYRWDMP